MSSFFFFFFSSRRRHTRFSRDWSSDVCSSDLASGTGTAQVLVAVTNQGAAPVRIDATSSTYVVKGADGKVVARGVFSYAFPVILAPGAVGYLLDSPLVGLVPIGDRDTASVQVDVSGVSSPGNPLEVTDLTWRRDAAGSISVSGT